MVGKVKKAVKPKKANKSKNKPLTLEEKLSDVKGRMNTIVEGDDPGYHLK
jgi:hypothetical protein|tara:strand:+ start:217 stop:366 length:150 start_codon:yes stop_codon:yes gene_type:complete